MLRALARDKGAFANEAAVALAKAQALESELPRQLPMLSRNYLRRAECRFACGGRGRRRTLVVEVDVDVRYFCSRSRYRRPHQIMIEVTEYE